MPLHFKAKMYILLYEKMSIYLCQKMYKQSYLLHLPRLTRAKYTNFASDTFKADEHPSQDSDVRHHASAGDWPIGTHTQG